MPEQHEIEITARDARRLAIAAQRLAGTPPRATRSGALALIREISYLQLDPTNVVARNPYQILQSRLVKYDPSTLDTMLTKREVFETPSLILPATDLHIHAATMRAYRRATEPSGAEGAYRKGDNAGGGTWARYARAWLTKNRHLRREALARLRRDGPLPLSAFEDRAIVSWTSAGWNNDRNLTMLLAILQRRGEIVVAGRRRGQKLYAAADRWLDGVRPLQGAALQLEATRRALAILQVATLKQLRWQYSFGRHVTPDAVAALERAGEIVRVRIDGVASKTPYYAFAGVERRVRRVNDGWTPRTVLLSPFDNLIIDRDRTHALFDYFYRMEIYVPAAKRKLGYWAMPVLHGDAIVGSVDPRYERDEGVLVVNKVVLRDGAPRGAMPAIRRAVDELAAFVGADRVRWPARS